MSEDQDRLELEYKFDASRVNEIEFRRTMMEISPTRFANFQHRDMFWQSGANVVRHRIKGDGSMELTNKARTSADTLVKRVEVNLGLSPRATESDVEAFMGATGYKPLFELKKDYIDLFTFDRESYEMEAALYHVRRSDESPTAARKYLEIEIKPNTEKEPIQVLGFWRDWLRHRLPLDEPLNLSLFEFYSQQHGTHYKI